MTDQIPTFGELLMYHRRRLNLSQQQAAAIGGIHASDLSKIERGLKKPPNAEVIMRWVRGFTMTRDESIQFVTAAGYSTQILEVQAQAVFNAMEYPLAKGNIADRLRGTNGFWPVWETDKAGIIVGANLLTYRLMSALDELDEAVDPDRLLGKSVYQILTNPQVYERIAPPSGYNDLWYSTIAVWNKIKRTVPVDLVADFERVIKQHPILSLILNYGTVNIEHEWEYTLRIYPSSKTRSFEEPKIYLEFMIHVERIMEEDEHKGYLFTAQPQQPYTIKRTEREYHRLLQTYGKHMFVQHILDTHYEEDKKKSPAHWPAFHINDTWVIIFENTAFLLLHGCEPNTTLFREQPYFAFLFSPLTEELTGGIDEEQLLVPIREFVQRTKGYEYDSKKAKQYARVKDCLLTALRKGRQQNLLTDLVMPAGDAQQEEKTDPVSFSLSYRNPLTEAFRLQFVVVTRLPYENESDYRITFKPENPATNMALILLQLQKNMKKNKIVLDELRNGEYEQLLWLLAIVTTVREGITKTVGDGDWKADVAFKHNYETLTVKMMDVEECRLNLQLALSQLLLEDTKRQNGILTMLKAFITSVHALTQEHAYRESLPDEHSYTAVNDVDVIIGPLNDYVPRITDHIGNGSRS